MTHATTTDIAYAVEHAVTAILGLLLLGLLAASTYRLGLRQFDYRSGKRLLWLAGIVTVGLIAGL